MKDLGLITWNGKSLRDPQAFWALPTVSDSTEQAS
jgi:hypothetical protein